MHVVLFTFYWTPRQDVGGSISVRPEDDLAAAMCRSHLITTQKAMIDALVHKLVENKLIDEQSGYTLIEYAYSEGAGDDLQD